MLHKFNMLSMTAFKTQLTRPTAHINMFQYSIRNFSGCDGHSHNKNIHLEMAAKLKANFAHEEDFVDVKNPDGNGQQV